MQTRGEPLESCGVILATHWSLRSLRPLKWPRRSVTNNYPRYPGVHILPLNTIFMASEAVASLRMTLDSILTSGHGFIVCFLVNLMTVQERKSVNVCSWAAMSSAPQLKIVKESESQFFANGNQHSSTFFLSVCLPVFRLGFCALRLILLLLLLLPGRYRSCRRSGKFFSLPGKREGWWENQAILH